MKKNIKILFFISCLGSGGRGRRFLELLEYLKKKGGYELFVILNHDIIHYKYFYKLNIPFTVLDKGLFSKSPTVIYRFFKYCKSFNPDIIHTWGRKQTLFSLMASLILRIPLINSQIASAPPNINNWSITNIIDRLNFSCSRIVLSNSKAGLDAYGVKGSKYRVIYNGINLKRFDNLPQVKDVKEHYKIKTPYSVIMAANIKPQKGSDLFVRMAKNILKNRRDTTFLLVGSIFNQTYYKKIKDIASNDQNIIFTGYVENVEELVNACEIGVLLSNKSLHGEGIPNTVLEYMALRKPVIATDAGGTKELIVNNKNGFLITDQNINKVAKIIHNLLDDSNLRKDIGDEGRKTIESSFTIKKMGENFEDLYNEVIKKPN